MAIKIIMLLVFFGVMVGIGLYCRKNAADVNGFVLGGRSVGPWLTAFAYGTSYFSAVVFVGYAGQFGWKYGIAATWAGIGNAVLGSLLAWVVLGRRTRIMTQHLDSRNITRYERSKRAGIGYPVVDGYYKNKVYRLDGYNLGRIFEAVDCQLTYFLTVVYE